jgi:hypothetical protein
VVTTPQRASAGSVLCGHFIEIGDDPFAGTFCKLRVGHSGDHSPLYADEAEASVGAPVIARCGYCKLPVLESDSRIFDGEQMYHEAHYADAMRGERDELKRLYLVARERVGKGYGFTSPQFVALPHPDSLRGQ